MKKNYGLIKFSRPGLSINVFLRAILYGKNPTFKNSSNKYPQ